MFKAMEKKNAVSKFPEFYYTRHMQAGLCGYEKETVLINQPAIEKMLQTFNGKPIYIQHQDVDFDTMKLESVGYVTDSWFDMDGWAWSKIMITDDEGHEKIKKGWAVSNAYYPTEDSAGGTKHNIPYDREITNGYFTHLALVDNPRYEDAKIYTPEQYQARNNQLMNSLANSNQPKKKGFVMKFWKKEEVSDASTADFVEYTNDKGQTVMKSVEEMKNALEADAKQKETLAKKVLVNGKEMSIAELTKAYEKLNAKKNKRNEDDEDEKENEGDVQDSTIDDADVFGVDDNLTNEDDEDEKEQKKRNKKNKKNTSEVDDEDKEEDDEKTNSVDHFKELLNAHHKKQAGGAYETPMTKLQRGVERYGNPNA